MRKLLSICLVGLLLLTGCKKAEIPENPYRLKTQILESYRQEGVQIVRSEYSYDENGWLTEIQTYFDDTLHLTRQYTRDDFGNAIRTQTDYADGTQIILEETLTLDDQNRVIYDESYFDGALSSTTEYEYNDAGLMTKLNINRIGIFEGQDVKSCVDMTYDRKGNLIREETRWEHPSISSEYTQYTYQKNRLVKTENYVDEVLRYATQYTYDDTGLIQTSLSKQSDGTPERKYITTFDEYGNELEKVAYAYASELARFGMTDEDPDSKTVNIYELKAP